MSANHDLERRLADFYAAETPTRAPEWVLESALATIDTTQQRRVPARAPRRALPTGPVAWLATAAAVAVAVGGIGLVALRLSQAPGIDPVSPTPTPTLDPATLRWAPDRLENDWPVPVRSEPPGGAPVLRMELAPDAVWNEGDRLWGPFAYADPVGEVAVGAPSWTDIKAVRVTPGIFSVDLAGDRRGVPDPTSEWIAYGLVLDTDGDGTADQRIGIDNMPNGQHRAWITDLASGETMAAAGAPYGFVDSAAGGRASLDSYYPGEGDQPGDEASFWYRVTNSPDYRFYAWAALIEPGRVVATDYAPDVGWLQAGDQPAQTLVGPTWTLDSPVTVNGEDMILPQSLSFTTNGTLTFDAGCKTGTANVTTEPGVLHVSEIATTDVSCSSAVAERTATFMAVLSAGDIAYTVEPGVLELRAGSSVLPFQSRYP